MSHALAGDVFTNEPPEKLTPQLTLHQLFDMFWREISHLRVTVITLVFSAELPQIIYSCGLPLEVNKPPSYEDDDYFQYHRLIFSDLAPEF